MFRYFVTLASLVVSTYGFSSQYSVSIEDLEKSSRLHQEIQLREDFFYKPAKCTEGLADDAAKLIASFLVASQCNMPNEDSAYINDIKDTIGDIELTKTRANVRERVRNVLGSIKSGSEFYDAAQKCLGKNLFYPW